MARNTELIDATLCFIMSDCFAYKPKKCVALKHKKCDGCNFYKTKTLHEADCAKAAARINAMDLCEREFIFAKYFTKAEPKQARKQARKRSVDSDTVYRLDTLQPAGTACSDR